MTVKKYLQDVRELNKTINRKLKELSDLRSMSTSIRGTNYAKDRVQTSFSSNAGYTGLVDRIVDLSKDIDADVDRFVDMKKQAERMIHNLPEREQAVLRWRYLTGCRWEEIADRLNCTIRNVHYLHRKGLEKTQDIVFDKTENTIS